MNRKVTCRKISLTPFGIWTIILNVPFSSPLAEEEKDAVVRCLSESSNVPEGYPEVHQKIKCMRNSKLIKRFETSPCLSYKDDKYGVHLVVCFETEDNLKEFLEAFHIRLPKRFEKIFQS